MKLLVNLTLVKKIAFMTTLGLLLAIGVFSLLGMRAVNEATEAMLEDRLTTASLVADYLDEVLGRAMTELRNTAHKIDSSGNNFDAQITTLEDAYRRFAIYIGTIYIVNEQGQVTWMKPYNPELAEVDLTYYPTVSQAIKEGKSGISGLSPAPLSNVPMVLLASPIGEDGKKGALVVSIDIAQSGIGGFVQPIKLGKTGYTEIVDQNGVVVARTQPGPKLSAFEKSDHSGRFMALIEAGEPTRGLCHTCHEPVQKAERRDVLAFVPLTSARWGVIIRQSEDEALASISKLRQSLLLFGAALVVIALLFVIMTTRDVISRVRMLTTASKKMAAGDLSCPITTSKKDEVGVLAETFEDMRSRLKSSYGELERRTRELSSLLAVSEILASSPDLSSLDTALGKALGKTLEIMGQDIGGILLLDENGQLRYRVHHGLSSEYIDGVSLRVGEGIAGKVAETGQPMLIKDISTDPRAAHATLVNVEGLRAFASVPLFSKEKVIGVLNIASRETRRFSDEDMRLLQGVASQISTAIEKARLHQEVKRKDEIRGELLKEIFSIQEEERKRIARELHDETSQVLASLNASLEAASGMLPGNTDKIKLLLKKAQTLSINILDEIHRLIYELRPSVLDDLGLVAATRWLIDNSLRTAGIKVNFKVVGEERRLPSQVEVTIFRVIQEAASNIVKHARARNAAVSLHFKKSAIRVHVRDEGVGFNIEEAISSKGRPRGLGLIGMKERVELMNGTLSIRSHTGSGGTEIDIEIPVNQEVTNEQDKSSAG